MLIPGLLMGRILLAKIREAAPPAAQATAGLATSAAKRASPFRASESVRASALARLKARRKDERERLSAGLRHAQALSTQPEPKGEFRRRQPYEAELREEDDVGETESTDRWLPIYRFNHIHLASLFSKLKIAMTGLALWMPLAEPVFGVGLGADAATMVGFAAFSTAFLLVVIRLTTRIIGVISIHETKDVLRVGYLNMWGLRRNAVVPVQNVLPLADYIDPSNISPLDIKVDLRRYGARGALYLPTVGADVVDADAFEYVFGHSAFTARKRGPLAKDPEKEDGEETEKNHKPKMD